MAPAAAGEWPIRIVRARTPDRLRQCHAVRAEVFIAEQGVSAAEELDGRDDLPGTVHVLALAGAGTPVGTARLLADGRGTGLAEQDAPPGERGEGLPVVHIGRVAVVSGLRGRQLGRRLMSALEEIALAEYGRVAGGERAVRVELSAQESALGFYERLGYRLAHERYLDADMWHRDAWKVCRGDS
ncbi:GNAT family N-acetyltransferase [Pseudactinotalea sp. HY158]|uniref:GNAT family N-acetyltransferase n=1 Tax=Pseudactinotalea sp. HY158 TaxID=2654547 RepID=UPI00129C8A55|nr:GNAT family N-acetyltransferase [Pseudactinotalea sp. HY158]QGH69821.1 GNAT family N-acetyltransferase [Pseudactinotalea sp. HY158]